MKKKGMDAKLLARAGDIEQQILIVHGHRVLLDSDLAALYGVATKALNQAVTRNISRFPEDFMFALSWGETHSLRSQGVTFKPVVTQVPFVSLRGRHRKYAARVFTEQGVAMLSSVLRSDRAIAVNIEVMRAFVRLRRILASNAELARKLAALEKNYDSQFKVVFDAIRQLMTPPEPPKKRPIGFADWPKE